VGVAAAVVAALCFQRVYVVSPDGIVGLASFRRDRTVIISGNLLASGAKVVRTTVDRSGPDVLLRVYMSPVEPADDRRTITGSFMVQIPVDVRLRSISVGDDDHFMTLGTLCGVTLRIPRFRHVEDQQRLVWRKSG
jgi:hypothetical protein